jgi:hypothetical protein
MVDVAEMPTGAFGYVPTPALVAPIEFTMRRSDYTALGGHADAIRPVTSLDTGNARRLGAPRGEIAPLDPRRYPWARGRQ